MKRIDLHGHTIKTPKDSFNRDIDSPQKCINILRRSNVGIFAVTNHNTFNFEQWNDLIVQRDKTYKDLILIPGIELSEKRKNKSGGNNQYNILVDPSCAKNFGLFVKSIIKNEKINEWKIDCIDFIRKFHKENDKVKIIILLDNKSNSKKKWSYKDIKKLRENIKKTNRLNEMTTDLVDVNNRRLLEVCLKTYSEKSLISSDNKNWADYEEEAKKLCQYWWDKEIKNYGDLHAFVKSPINQFEKLISKLKKEQFQIQLKSEDGTPIEGKENVKIVLYPGVNVIFGGKASGKTVMLKAIEREIDKKTEKTKAVYLPKEVEKKHKNKFVDLEPKDTFREEISKYASFANKLMTFVKENEPPDIFKFKIKNYWSWEKYVDTLKLKLQFTHSDSKAKLSDYFDSRESIINDLLDFKSKLESDIYTALSSKYKENLKKWYGLVYDNINKIVNFLGKKQWDEVTSVFFEKLKKIFNDARDDAIKTHKGLERPEIKLFNLYDWHKKWSKIIEWFMKYKKEPSSKKEIYSDTFVFSDKNLRFYGEIKPRINTNVSKPYEKITGKNMTLNKNEFQKFDINIKKLKKNLFTSSESINNVRKEWVDSDKSIVDQREKLSNALFVYKYFFENDDDGSTYVPSDGERAFLVLQDVLNSDADYYLLDEPETHIGNDWLRRVVLEKISDIEKNKKVLVIVTHSPLIGINTIPINMYFISSDHNLINGHIFGAREKNRSTWYELLIKNFEGSKSFFDQKVYLLDALKEKCKI